MGFDDYVRVFLEGKERGNSRGNSVNKGMVCRCFLLGYLCCFYVVVVGGRGGYFGFRYVVLDFWVIFGVV